MVSTLLRSVYCGSLLIVMAKATIATEDLGQHNLTSKDDVVEMIFQRAIPTYYESEDSPANVSVGVAIVFLSISSVKFSRMEIEVEFEFFAVWKDDRLIFDEHDEEYMNKYSFRLPDIVKKRLWVPWIYFPECKLCKDSFVTGKEPKPMGFMPKTRELVIVFRDTMSFNCQYDLTFYPFDVHTCSIALQLHADAWMELNDSFSTFFDFPPDRFISSGMPTEFYFDKVFVKQACSPKSFGPAEDHDHCLQYGISFHRITAYYLMLIYTPSIVIVVISWISFWLATDAIAPRVTLGLMSLLTMTTQFSNAQKDLPPVAYVKALDVWMLACVVMVFGSLLEFTLACNTEVQHNDVKPVLKRKELKHSLPVCTEKKVKRPAVTRKSREPAIKEKQVNPLDAKARVAFPFVFMLFNMIYWPWYGRGG